MHFLFDHKRTYSNKKLLKLKMNGKQTSYGYFTYAPIPTASFTINVATSKVSYDKIDNYCTSHGHACWDYTTSNN